MIDTIIDHCNRMLIVYYILIIILSLFFIFVPTIIVFFQCPEDIRMWISTIVGGILSVIVMPIVVNFLSNKHKENRTLRKMSNEINKPLYDESDEYDWLNDTKPIPSKDDFEL